MKKHLFGLTAIFALATQPLAFAQENAPPLSADYSYEEDEDEDFLPQGKPVGAGSNDGIRAARRARFRNWGLAFVVVALGVATLVLVAKKH